MDEFLVWEEKRQHAYFNVHGNLEDDRAFLGADSRFAPCSGGVEVLHKVVFFVEGLWFMGYFMKYLPRERVLVQRAYGKLYNTAPKSALGNVNKFKSLPVQNVLLFNQDGFERALVPVTPTVAAARALTTRNVKVPKESAYTLYMLSDMIKTAKICPNVDVFKDWFEIKYLRPSRTNTLLAFRIPHFETFDDALNFLGEFRINYPAQYKVFDEDALTELAEWRNRG